MALPWPIQGLELLGEIRGETDDELKDHDIVFNLGFRWYLNENVGLLLSSGRGLRGFSGGEPEFLSYLGLQLVF